MKPRIYIVPIEWQIFGTKTNADNSVECVEKSAADKLVEVLDIFVTCEPEHMVMFGREAAIKALKEYRGEE